jgi:hypothetical protein
MVTHNYHQLPLTRLAQPQKIRPYSKTNKAKKAGIAIPLIEHLPSKCKFLSSDPRPAKRNKNKSSKLKELPMAKFGSI